MCGRYGFAVTNPEAFRERFAVDNDDIALTARYNAAPGQQLPVITHTSPNRVHLMTWGLIPFWSKDDSAKYSMINARAEGIGAKPAFRRPIRNQRCLVPATGFYEWDKSVKPSVPYNIGLKDGALFAFAGLYDRWTDPTTGEERYTYTIITTEPNELVARIHNRMPVILKPEDEAVWLDPDETDPLSLAHLLKAYPADLMTVYAIGRGVNNVKNDAPSLIQPV